MTEPVLKCKHCGNEHERRLLACPECGKLGITSLYKYLSFNQHSLSLLINNEVWFSKAVDVNDPFEFKFRLSSMEMRGISVSKAEIQEARKDAMQLGVYCLSEINDNILMWSHYASNHTGFCIEFERTKENDLKPESCVPIIYPDDDSIPVIENEELESSKTFAKIATTKSKLWSYEKEWRIISREIGGRTSSLPGDITSIIFGCRMNEGNRNTIRKILKTDIKYYEAIENDSQYKLNIEPLINA